MLLVKRAYFARRVFLENVLCRNPLSGCGPHIGNVEILHAVIVMVEPTDAHASANVFPTHISGYICERSIAVIAIYILASEIIHNVEVGPAIAVVIVPCATKAVAGVVLA